MRIVKLKKDSLFPFLKTVSEDADLWAPVKKAEGRFVFRIVDDPSEIALHTTRTILPPKKIFLPPKMTMFRASSGSYEADFSHVSRKILFGVHPCDIHALLIMEQFHSHHYDDPYFLEARRNTLVLGLSCWPDEHCLCRSTGTDIVEEGYDLFFSELDEDYLVWIGSSRGDDLVRMTPDIFEEDITDADIKGYIRWREERSRAFRTEIRFKDMPDLMELKYGDPLWEKAGEACLACGSCSAVCPTCNCYNVQDRPLLGVDASDITRCWDACTLENYSAVAGGENFRETRSRRLKLFYTHKLQAYISKYGKPACVGCGRCAATCPVDINVETIARALDGENGNAFWTRQHEEVTP